VLGPSAWLLTRAATEPVEGLYAARLNDPELAAFSGEIAAWLDAHGAEAVLVRADRYVFGTDAPGALAEEWQAALAQREAAAA